MPQRKTHRVRPFSPVASSSRLPVNRHHVSNSGPMLCSSPTTATRSPGRLRRRTAINSGKRPDPKVFRPISRSRSAFIALGAFYSSFPVKNGNAQVIRVPFSLRFVAQTTCGPLKPDFGLSGAVRRRDRAFLPLSRFRARLFRLDLLRASRPRDITKPGPFTPLIIALRRSAPVGMTELGRSEHPTQAKTVKALKLPAAVEGTTRLWYPAGIIVSSWSRRAGKHHRLRNPANFCSGLHLAYRLSRRRDCQ